VNHWVTYPLVGHPLNPALIDGSNVKRFVRAAEDAGFDGIGFTDHPAPSQKWLESGGHDALDPFAALSFVAAATSSIRLIPNVVVLPYRNPFIVAKSAATIDALSGGRFVLSVATGYLRGEFRAVGVDFERRNELVDDALAVLRGVWAKDEFSYEGNGFIASGVTANPKPTQVPIWIGGNSAITRGRVAQFGDGWNPFRAPASLAATTRTRPLESADELRGLIDDLRRRVEAGGRDPETIDVSFTSGLPSAGEGTFSSTAHVDAISDLADIGVTWTNTSVPSDTLEHALESLEQYGTEVISTLAS
jgi:probable F420-dependent oxidoreductase